VYPYDESCSDILAEEVCNHQKSFLSFYQSCKWTESNKSCGYEGPSFTLYHVFLFSSFVVITSSLYNQVLDWILDQSFITITKLYSSYSKESLKVLVQTDLSDYSTVSNSVAKISDEFKCYETQRLLFLRAARLEKLFSSSTYLTRAEETEIVMKANKTKMMKFTAVDKNLMMFITCFAQFNDIQQTFSEKQIRKLIKSSRIQAKKLNDYLSEVKSTEKKEITLMKCFFLDHIPQSYKSIIKQNLFSSYERLLLNDSLLPDIILIWMDQIVSIFSVIIILLHFILLSYYSISFDSLIISRNSSVLWSVVLVVSLFQYHIFIESILIVIKDVFITQHIVIGQFSELIDLMTRRTKLILMRSSGLMRDAHALVQHLNPACRVARLHPSLPVSRLLLSMSDLDVGSFDIPQPWTIKIIIAKMCVFPFSYVPFKIGEMIMLIMILIAWNGIILGFYFLEIYNYILAISIASILGGFGLIAIAFMLYPCIKKISSMLYNIENMMYLFSYKDENRLPHSDKFFDIDDDSLVKELPEITFQKPYIKSSSSFKYTDNRTTRYDYLRVKPIAEEEEKSTDQEGNNYNNNNLDLRAKHKKSHKHRRIKMKVPLVLNFTTIATETTATNDRNSKKLSFYEQHFAFKNAVYDLSNTFTNHNNSRIEIKESSEKKHMKRKSKKEVPIAYGESSMKGQRLSWDDLNDINQMSSHDKSSIDLMMHQPDSDNDIDIQLSQRLKPSHDKRHRRHQHKKGVVLPYLVDNEEAPLSFYSDDYVANAADDDDYAVDIGVGVSGNFPYDGNIDRGNFLETNGIGSTDAVIANFYDSNIAGDVDNHHHHQQQLITTRNTMINSSFNSMGVMKDTKMNRKDDDDDDEMKIMMLTPSLLEQAAIFEASNLPILPNDIMPLEHLLNKYTPPLDHNQEYKYSRRKLNSFRRKSPPGVQTWTTMDNDEGPGNRKEDNNDGEDFDSNNGHLSPTRRFHQRNNNIPYMGPMAIPKKLPYIGPGQQSDLNEEGRAKRALLNRTRPSSSTSSRRPGQREFAAYSRDRDPRDRNRGPGQRDNHSLHEYDDYKPFDYMLTNIMLSGHDGRNLAVPSLVRSMAASNDFFFNKSEHAHNNNSNNNSNNDIEIKLNTPMNERDLHNQPNDRVNRYRNRVKGSHHRGYG
jgi:hypothetical protein